MWSFGKEIARTIFWCLLKAGVCLQEVFVSESSTVPLFSTGLLSGTALSLALQIKQTQYLHQNNEIYSLPNLTLICSKKEHFLIPQEKCFTRQVNNKNCN